jgi:hypothetical protein
VFAEPLIDCEEDRTRRAMLIGMLREMERGRREHPLTASDWFMAIAAAIHALRSGGLI